MRRHSFYVFCFAFALLFGSGQADGTSGRIRFGINWMMTDVSSTRNYLYHSYDSLGFNTYHVGGGVNWDSVSDPIAWSQNSTGKVIPAHERYPVDKYSGAERMVYQCIPKQSGLPLLDSLKAYYFQGFPKGNRYPATITTRPTHWEIPDSTSHTDVVVIDSVELLNGPTYYNRMWRDRQSTAFKVAVKLQVARDSADTTPVIEVWVRAHRSHSTWCHDTTTSDTVVYKFGIPWNSMATTGDEVHFSDYFRFPFDLSDAYHDNACDLLDVLLEVHSKRIVTTRIAWVALEDEWAHNLLAGKDLDSNDVFLRATRDSTRDTIIRDARYMRDNTNKDSTLLYIYLHDEPQVSEFTCQGRVLQILRDSVKIEGVTERGTYQMKRYAAHVASPAVFWSGDFISAALFNPFLDSGPGHGSVVAYDSLALPTDTTYSFYRDSTLASIHHASSGYFPVVGGHPVSDTVYSTDSTYSIDWRATGTTLQHPNTGGHTAPAYAPYSFDVCDFAPYNQHLALHANYRSAMEANRLVYLDSTMKSFRPKEWWANMFITRNLQKYDPATGGWYYNTEVPLVAEQLNMLSASVICSGGHGILYWWGVSRNFDADTNLILPGFTDNWGRFNSDSTTYGGFTIPTMYRSHCDFAGTFHRWLQNWADSLYDKPWIGGYIRYDSIDAAGLFSLYHEGTGRNPIVVPDSDFMTRPMINHWPSTPGDTSVHIVQKTLPDSLRFVQYGFFEDTLAKKQGDVRYYACIVNLSCDGRDVYCHRVPFSDSTSVRRGTRTLISRMALDSLRSQYWKITAMDDSHETQIVQANGTMKWVFRPGEGRIFKVEPYVTSLVGRSYIDYNNGRRCEYDGKHYHICYYRADSVFYRRSLTNTPTAWGSERYIDGSSAGPASHPSLCLVPVPGDTIHRVAITYQAERLGNYRVMLNANSHDGDSTYWGGPTTLAIYPTAGASFEPTPVVVPYVLDTSNYGALVAWAQDTMGIGLRGLKLAPTGYYYPSNAVYVRDTGNAAGFQVLDKAHGFPTMRPDTTYQNFGLAFQVQAQPHGQIMFGLVNIATSGGNLVINAPGIASLKWASKITGADCDNSHPCVDGAFPYATQLPGSTWAHWIWHVTWDASQYLIPIYHVGDFPITPRTDTTQIIWEAAWDGSWHYTMFRPPTNGTAVHDNYRYPSLRIYNGMSLHVNQPGNLSWYTDRPYMFFAHTLRAYQSLSPVDTVDWTIVPFHSIRATLGVPNPDSARCPNLEINGRTFLSYNSQHAAYEATPDASVRMVVNNLINLDTAGETKHFLYLRSSDGQSCFSYNYLYIDPRTTVHPDSSSAQLDTRTWNVLPRIVDSVRYDLGVRAVTDTLLLDSTNDRVQMLRSSYTEDSTDLKVWLGTTGRLRVRVQAMSAATGLLLRTVDSMDCSASNVGARFDTITCDLSALRDSMVYFRILVDTVNVAMCTTIAANGFEIVPPPIDSTGGFAKSSGEAGRLGHVPNEINPINLDVFPNPFQSNVSASYDIPVEDADDVTDVIVYNMLVKEVAHPIHDFQVVGKHTITIDGSAFPTGRYIVAVHTRTHQQSKLIILTR